MLPEVATAKTGTALPATLRAIEARYGEPTTRFIALELEYAWKR